MTGVAFTAGRQSGKLNELTLRAGDVLTMTWTGWAPGCAPVVGAVSLVAHGTVLEQFDPAEDQPLLTSITCEGLDGCASGASGNFGLTLALPGSVTCLGQIDAVTGPPLSAVGPTGGYYESRLVAATR